MTDEELRIIKKIFGENLQKIRQAKGLSLLDVSYECSIDKSNISKIEHGRVNVTLHTIAELAKGLDISPAELLNY